MRKTKNIIENRVKTLETEILVMRRILGAKIEKKDPNAWDKLNALGKKISKSWKSKKPSWKLISEFRR